MTQVACAFDCPCFCTFQCNACVRQGEPGCLSPFCKSMAFPHAKKELLDEALPREKPLPFVGNGSCRENQESGSALSSNASSKPAQSRARRFLHLMYDVLTYVPLNCRWDLQDTPRFSPALNILFGSAACITVASLYYTHPILAVLAVDFDVSDYAASQVPTYAQAGYAAGLLFICPLGDQLPRRAFVLLLVWLTGTLWCVDPRTCR